MGIYGYGGKFSKESSAADIVGHFEDKKQVRTAGRLMAVRLMGKTSFCDLKDETGRVQLFVKPELLGEAQTKLFGSLDIGDIVGVAGELFKTRTGEISI